MKTALDTSGATLNAPTSTLQGYQKKREKGPKKKFEEIIAEKFPNVGKEIIKQVQESQRVPGRINPRRNTPRHIVIELTKIKDKDKILKATREKRQNNTEKKSTQLSADFSKETLQARREWHGIFQVIKGKKLQLRTLPSKTPDQI